jgi:hypothetical protein
LNAGKPVPDFRARISSDLRFAAAIFAFIPFGCFASFGKNILENFLLIVLGP